jgi:hypothetical protein
VLCSSMDGQAALTGLLNKLNRLDLTLLSPNQAEPCTTPTRAEYPRSSLSCPVRKRGSPGAAAEGGDDRREEC